jgi:predicted ATP-grasp superfamily ATP-dependent carboligase
MLSVPGVLPGKLLLVSCSARLLAQSASRASIRSVALDHYADADTRISAEISLRIPDTGRGFDQQALLDAASLWAPAEEYPLVYGGGFDASPDLLVRLVQGRELIGNSATLLSNMRNPHYFFSLLDQLDIPYPEISFDTPDDPENWLVKAGCSEGGKGVRFCEDAVIRPDDYFQRKIEGSPASALFLANGRQATIIGFSTLWTESSADNPFLFIGAMSHVSLSAEERYRWHDRINALVRMTGLKGLNSMDFMMDTKGTLRVLEVNTRPSATMALYEPDYPEGLLAAHIRCCQGLELPDAMPTPAVRAFRVVITRSSLSVGEAANWPLWCDDLPVPHSVISQGQPLCTVRAESETVQQTLGLIRERVDTIHRFIAPFMI